MCPFADAQPDSALSPGGAAGADAKTKGDDAAASAAGLRAPKAGMAPAERVRLWRILPCSCGVFGRGVGLELEFAPNVRMVVDLGPELMITET